MPVVVAEVLVGLEASVGGGGVGLGGVVGAALVAVWVSPGLGESAAMRDGSLREVEMHEAAQVDRERDVVGQRWEEDCSAPGCRCRFDGLVDRGGCRRTCPLPVAP